jgi:hypothetical protein
MLKMLGTETLLETLDADRNLPQLSIPPISSSALNELQTQVIEPPTDRALKYILSILLFPEHFLVLQRVHAFLPLIEASNAALATADHESIDIERVDPDSEQYIQMNLGLGVYEQRRPRSSSPFSQSLSSSSRSSSSSSITSDSSTISSSGSSDSDDPITSFLRASRAIRPLPRRSQPPIFVMPSLLDGDGTDLSESPSVFRHTASQGPDG